MDEWRTIPDKIIIMNEDNDFDDDNFANVFLNRCTAGSSLLESPPLVDFSDAQSGENFNFGAPDESVISQSSVAVNEAGLGFAGCHSEAESSQRREEIMIECNRRSVMANNLKMEVVTLKERFQAAKKLIGELQQKTLNALGSAEPLTKKVNELNEQLNATKNQLIAETRERCKFQMEAEAVVSLKQQLQASQKSLAVHQEKSLNAVQTLTRAFNELKNELAGKKNRAIKETRDRRKIQMVAEVQLRERDTTCASDTTTFPGSEDPIGHVLPAPENNTGLARIGQDTHEDNTAPEFEELGDLVIDEEFTAPVNEACPAEAEVTPQVHLQSSQVFSPSSELQQISLSPPVDSSTPVVLLSSPAIASSSPVSQGSIQVPDRACADTTPVLSRSEGTITKMKRKHTDLNVTEPAATKPKRSRQTNASCSRSSSIGAASASKINVKLFKENKTYAAILDSMLSDAATTPVKAYEKWMKQPKSAAETVACSFVEAIKRYVGDADQAVEATGTKAIDNDKRLLDLLKALLEDADVPKWSKVPEVIMDLIKRQLALTGEMNAEQLKALCRWCFRLCRRRPSAQSVSVIQEILLIVLQVAGKFVIPEYYDSVLSVFLSLAIIWPLMFKKIMTDANHDVGRAMQAVFRFVLLRSSFELQARASLDLYMGHLCDVNAMVSDQKLLTVEFLTREQLDILSCLLLNVETTETGIRLPADLFACLNKIALLAPYCVDEEITNFVQPYLIELSTWYTSSPAESHANGGLNKVIADIYFVTHVAPFCHELVMHHINDVIDSLRSLIFDSLGSNAVRFSSRDQLLLIYASIDFMMSLSITGGSQAKDFLEDMFGELSKEKNLRSDATKKWYEKRYTQLLKRLKN